MSAKAKAQLAGQTVGVIGGSSGIGLETALPFCLYSPKCLERLGVNYPGAGLGMPAKEGGTVDVPAARHSVAPRCRRCATAS